RRRERAPTGGVRRVREDHVEPPRVADLGLDVVIRRERGREIGDVPEAVAEADVLREVGRVGEASLASPVVLYLQARGAGHEVDVVAAELRVGSALAVVERERARGGFERFLD